MTTQQKDLKIAFAHGQKEALLGIAIAALKAIAKEAATGKNVEYIAKLAQEGEYCAKRLAEIEAEVA